MKLLQQKKRISSGWGRRSLGLALAVLLAGALGLPCRAAGENDPAVAVDPTGQGEGYSAVLYDNANGRLPTSEANAIAETGEGFLWIGSYSGLIRYDGNTFERMDSTTGIASVVSLYVDGEDRLWIGTNDSGLAVMEKGEMRLFGKGDGLGSSSVRSITQGPEGDLYAATTRGVVRIDGEMELHPIEDPRISEEYVRELRVADSGVIYGVTEDSAVFTLRDGRVEEFFTKADLGGVEVLTVLPDPQAPGKVYLGTERSQIYHGTLAEGLPDAQVLDAAPLEYINAVELFDGDVWICADNGIGLLKDGVFQVLQNVPLSNSVEHVMTDYAGNLWFTSSRQGVMKIVPNQFTDVFERYGLPPAVVNTTCLFEGRLFIGTDDGLTVVGEGGALTELPLTRAASASGEDLGETDLLALLRGCRIRSILRDGQHRLWLCTYSKKGLVCYDGSSAVTFTAADGLPSDRVRTVYQREDGSLVAACSVGAAVIREDRVDRVLDGLSATPILTVSEGAGGRLILGTDGEGLYVLGEETPLRLGAEDGLASEIIMRVKKDPRRELYWIVTSNSLAYMTADYQITTVKNFPYSNNFDLYENSQGETWVLSSNGVYVVSTEELLANEEISPVYYSTDNGLPCIATANSYSELTEDGDLYIAGSTGVAKVNIEVPLESVENVKMAVPYVEADGELLYPDEEGVFRLPASVRRLTVYPFVFTYSLTNPQVTYRLEGFEDQGTTLRRNELDPVDYTNLGGGEYRFILQLRDAMGRGSQELEVAIVQAAAFYETPWFYVLCGLLGLGIIAATAWLVIRRKTRVFQKKQEENRTFIREMIEAFAKTIDMKDEYTNGHSGRVAKYTAMLTRELGYDEETAEKYYNIALLHDIGKIGIPEAVLNKPGKLTDEEYAVLQSHATLGYEALKDISIMPELAIGAVAHHERPDGKGYPNGLTGDRIPRVAQIIAVADTFDAMYSTRTYRNRMNFDKVVSVIREVSGTQLTPDVVDAFLRLVERGELRDPEDHGGGSLEEVDNIPRS